MDENEILEWDYYIDGVKYWTTIDPEDGTLPKKRTVHKDEWFTRKFEALERTPDYWKERCDIEKVLEVQADEISALRLENEELKMKLCRFKEAITHLQAND